ncbi:hypothetical protein NLU13_0914 [Sarocladium strictum]|uniref:Uncharacterized protein n=1 Tax=Sarocladium strictum TaxID=5046 RepID=A0AA39LBY9_SARSR|nr:hypothetical protein NLU13_0914 [Sarocladium strictum]
MPSQRPFFLSSFFAAFRPQGPTIQSTASQTPNKHTHQPSSSPSAASHHHHHPYSTSAVAAAAAAAAASSNARNNTASASSTTGTSPTQTSSVAIHSPRGASHNIPIPGAGSPSNRRRGSDSSSEGFRDVIGADKWYIGGRMAGGEEKFFKLGVVRRVRSNDGLSLDRLSL